MSRVDPENQQRGDARAAKIAMGDWSVLEGQVRRSLAGNAEDGRRLLQLCIVALGGKPEDAKSLGFNGQRLANGEPAPRELRCWLIQLLDRISKSPHCDTLVGPRPRTGRRPGGSKTTNLKKCVYQRSRILMRKITCVDAVFSQIADELKDLGTVNPNTKKPVTKAAVQDWYYEIHNSISTDSDHS